LRCYKIRKLLDAYLRERLPQKQRNTIETHLKNCTECKKVLEELERLNRLLNAYAAPPAPSDLTDRIMAEARSRRDSTITSPWRDLPDAFSPMVWRTATAFMLIIGLTAGSLLGWSAWQKVGVPASNVAMNSSVITAEEVHGLDAFGDAPAGSIESAVISLVVKER